MSSTYAWHMPARRFAYRLGPRSMAVLRLFGVHGAEDAWVDLGDDTLTARFGRFSATTPIANIASWRIEGPWNWITAIGVRRSFRHADITFGGSPAGGVRLDFREPIKVGPTQDSRALPHGRGPRGSRRGSGRSWHPGHGRPKTPVTLRPLPTQIAGIAVPGDEVSVGDVAPRPTDPPALSVEPLRSVVLLGRDHRGGGGLDVRPPGPVDGVPAP